MGGGLVGGGVGFLVLVLLRLITQDLYEKLAPAMVAIIIAMVFGRRLIRKMAAPLGPQANASFQVFITVTFVLIFGYVGIYLGLNRASSMHPPAVERTKSGAVSLKLVDTSVIIDGRIADICESGFIEGTLMVPRFVLDGTAAYRRLLRCAPPRQGPPRWIS